MVSILIDEKLAGEVMHEKGLTDFEEYAAGIDLLGLIHRSKFTNNTKVICHSAEE